MPMLCVIACRMSHFHKDLDRDGTEVREDVPEKEAIYTPPPLYE